MLDLLSTLPEKLIVKCVEQNNETGVETELARMHIHTVAQAISQHFADPYVDPLCVARTLLDGGEYVVMCEKVTRKYSITQNVNHG